MVSIGSPAGKPAAYAEAFDPEAGSEEIRPDRMGVRFSAGESDGTIFVGSR